MCVGVVCRFHSPTHHGPGAIDTRHWDRRRMVGTSSSHPEWGAGFSRWATGPRSVRRALRPHQVVPGRGPGVHPPGWVRSDSAQWARAPKQAQSWCRPQEVLGRCRYRGPQHRTGDSDRLEPRPLRPAATTRNSRLDATPERLPLINPSDMTGFIRFPPSCGRAGPRPYNPGCTVLV